MGVSLPIQIFVAEAMGTFILLSAILATGKAIPIGLALAAAIFIGSFASGAHFNPAVTLIMALKGTIRPEASMFYLLGQISGALAALYWYQSIPTKFTVHQ